MAASLSRPAAPVSFGQSAFPKKPDRSLCASTRASEHNIRSTNCSLDISKLKMATVSRFSIAAYCAMDKANAVLPMDGRPARIIKSDG